MRVRIFTAKPDVLQPYFNLLERQARNGADAIQAMMCSPLQWLPPATADASTVADLHIYVGQPVRIAVPWARFNLFVGDAAAAVEDDMDLTVPASDLTGESKQVLATLRSWFAVATRRAHPPTLPAPPPSGVPPPKIAILTATGARVAWWTNMVRNVTGQAWPVSRLEWCIVDDDAALGTLVEELRERAPALTIHYKTVAPGTTIGAKRNAAAAMAGADVSVFAVMDDDDHYPANSLSARVSWLSRAGSGATDIVYCSTLPMYDLRRYISAINVPPLTDSARMRVSEASMVFTRTAWEERPFPDSSMAEGAGFLKGRESRSVEIGPADVIVSFIHAGNTSSRRVPAAQEPNGCHFGFSDEYFQYVHSIGGGVVDVSGSS